MMHKKLIYLCVVLLSVCSCRKEVKIVQSYSSTLPAFLKTHSSLPVVFASSTTRVLDSQDPNVMSIIMIEHSSGRQALNPLLIHMKTGQVSWLPVIGDVGIYKVAFRATDPNEAYDEEIVEITVSPRTNRPPVVFARLLERNSK